MMAVRIPDLAAAVPFYGGQPTAEDVPKIKAPLLLHYAELDTRVNEGWPAYEAHSKKTRRNIPLTCMKRRITDSITTQHHGTIKQRRNLRGKGR